jgi:pimeloyl-ACP methyl ester carboxylesterase
MKRWRLLRGIAIVLALIIFTLYVALPVAAGLAAIWPQNAPTGEPPEGFAAISLPVEDGARLAAWYAEPSNGAAIILVHGAGGGRESVRPYAAMLRDNGFGVLALEMRGFGASDGRINRLGWRGTEDIGAAVAYLQARDNVEAIGGLGISVGGEALLGAAAAFPQLRAIVADGATFRTLAEYEALPENRTFLRNYAVFLRSAVVDLLSGEDPPAPLLASIQQSGGTAFLFIAAGAEETEIAFNEVFQRAAAPRGDLWVIPAVGHSGGFASDPAVYEQRVTSFFTDTLLD